MRRVTCRVFGIVFLATCAVAVAGCAEMPRTFRAIELGKPLDRSLLPASAVVEEVAQSPADEPHLFVAEYHQNYLPVGLRRHTLLVYRDAQGNVSRVRHDAYSISYWVVLLTGSDVSRERFLDADGATRERTIKNMPLYVGLPLPNFLVFTLGVDQCFQEAGRRRAAAEAPDDRSTPPAGP